MPLRVKAERYSIARMYRAAGTHACVAGHVACFHLLTIVNSAAVNVGAQMSVHVSDFCFEEYMTRSEATGSHGNSTFNVFEELS